MIQSILDVDIVGKKLIIREDFNVPIRDQNIQSSKRIKAALPTLEYALRQQASVLVLAHLGDPKCKQTRMDSCMKPIAIELQKHINQPVNIVENIHEMNWRLGQIALMENVRFFDGEKTNSDILAKSWGEACDVFVMDAFGVLHREHASTCGIAKYAPKSVAGLLVKNEISSIDKAILEPQKPVLFIIGGSKISTKMHVIQHLVDRADDCIIGGAMANTCLVAQGFDVGNSMYEAEEIEHVHAFLNKAHASNCTVHLPTDVRVSSDINATDTLVFETNNIPDHQGIFDIGPRTIKRYERLIQSAGTIVWNGPVGAFENPVFAHGTRALAESCATGSAYSVVGGGDTILALEASNVSDKMDFISTGGGAFLSYLSGVMPPGLRYLLKQ